MSEEQRMVSDFHLKMGQPAPSRYIPLSKGRAKLRLSLILEEVQELALALDMVIGEADFGKLEAYDDPSGFSPDHVEAIDALCDLLYVTYGTAVEMGIDLDPFFREVHRTNMAKEGGGEREDGKILKPQGWEPPRIGEILERLVSSEQ